MTEHVFISYARKDGESHALKFDSELPRLGFATWRDRRGIDPTQDFTAEIEKAIEASSYVVTCITPDVRREDSFVRREIAYAQVINKPIIVARFADVPPPISVVSHTWLDFFKNWETAFQQLCALLKQPAGNYTAPLPSSDDPYKPYLDALYKQIVRYLDKTVFSMLPGQSNTALITLRSEATPDAVQPSEEIEAQALPLAFFDMAGVGEETAQTKTYHSFQEAFDKYHGRVLLLGEPGGGKTTTLFAFARDRVAQRLQDAMQPLPILVPIALWDAEKQPSMAGWLAQIIPLLKNDVVSILAEGKALLLLDGLDELGDEREDQKTQEKYDPRRRFMHTMPHNNQVLISCRIKDYNDIGAKMLLQGAVTLHSLDDAQMQIYLKDMPELWEVLAKDDELREVARTPLLLSFFTFAFAGLDEEAKQLKDLSKGDVRDTIFETYVRKRYEHEKRRLRHQAQQSLDGIFDILGSYALSNIVQVVQETNKFTISDTDSLSFELALKLNLTVSSPNAEGVIYHSFIHLLLRDHFALKVAVKILHDTQSPRRLRLSALYALGELKEKRTIPVLIKTLSDENPQLRSYAVAALGKMKSVDTFEQIVAMLQDDDKYVRSTTIYALGRLGDERAFDHLISLLSDEVPLTRDNAAEALGKLGDPRAISPLTIVLKDAVVNIRRSAAQALGRIGSEHAIAALAESLEDNDDYVVKNVIEALTRIGTPEALAAIEVWKRKQSHSSNNFD